MDREQEEMQFLGLSGFYQESFKIIHSHRRVFSKITLALILPLSFIFLAHIDVSEFLFHKIMHTEFEIDRTQKYTSRYEHLRHTISSERTAFWLFKFTYFTLLLVFSLLSTSAVVYTVASIYSGRDVTFRKVMSVVPKVWKRLMETFLCAYLAFVLYNVVTVLTLILLGFSTEHVNIVGPVCFVLIVILYVLGLAYMTLIWQLASVVSVLEDFKGFKAMTKSRNLLKGKMRVAIVIFFELNISMVGIQILFQSLVVLPGLFSIVGRLVFGLVCLLLLFTVFLFGLVLQTVIYFVCKSYHHENIDKSTLSVHLEVYLGDQYVPMKSKDVQLEQFVVIHI